MKIHVVQRGETLWEISQKYGVDFEELKAMNTHLSNPDMIMPGMKIKVPTTSKQVKKEKPLNNEMKKYPGKEKEEKKNVPLKDSAEKKKLPLNEKEEKKKVPMMGKEESKKQPTKQTYKDTSKKSLPVIKEDDHKKSKKEEFAMKQAGIPNLPKMEKDMWKAKANTDLPHVPKYDKPKNNDQQPMHQPQAPTNYPNQQIHHQPMQQPMYQPMSQPPVMPMNYYQPMPHCLPMNPVPYPAQQMPLGAPSHPMVENFVGDNNMHSYPNVEAPYHNHNHNLPYNEEPMESSSSSMEMPQMPQHLPGVYQNDISNQHPAYGQGFLPNQQMYPSVQPEMSQFPNHNQPIQPVPYNQPYSNYPQQPMGYQSPYGDTGYNQQPYYPQAHGSMLPNGPGYPNPHSGGYGYPQPNTGAPQFDLPYNPGYRQDEDESE
ncbi:SafA/ExsA family spore coat assembly protein [Aquibacillus halophilus]|uniref:SafA/ExsA family spore coat assembly protein n=1 Tax=Aquibacillus halophilus TaxID=930132 RepID=UPI00129AD58D